MIQSSKDNLNHGTNTNEHSKNNNTNNINKVMNNIDTQTTINNISDNNISYVISNTNIFDYNNHDTKTYEQQMNIINNNNYLVIVDQIDKLRNDIMNININLTQINALCNTLIKNYNSVNNYIKHYNNNNKPYKQNNNKNKNKSFNAMKYLITSNSPDD